MKPEQRDTAMRKTKTISKIAAALFVIVAQQADAQLLPRVVYYGPPVVAAPAPVVVAPAPTVVYRPVIAAPAPVYAPAVVPAATPVVTTRYRPILGGTVTRARYYSPFYAY